MMSNKVRSYNFGEYCLDLVDCKLMKNDEPIHLAKKTFRILTYFIENAGQMIKKEEFLEKFWEGNYMEETNLAQHIYRIRKALDTDKHSEHYIETIPKFGYRFVGEVSKELAFQESDKTLTEDDNLFDEVITPPTDFFSKYEIKERLEKEAGLDLRHTVDEINQDDNSVFIIDKRIALIGVLGIFIAFLTGYIYFFSQEVTDVKEIESLAVLPFKQIGETENEKLGLGLADTIISRLSNQKKIAVSPTSTIIRFVDKEKNDPIEIGKKLKVNAVLTGTIQRNKELVRVNVQLIDVNKEIPIWSEKFDARFLDIFSLQDRISDQVAKTFLLETPAVDENKFKDKNTETANIKAYQAYTIGLFYWGKRDVNSLLKAAEYFEKSVYHDAKFAKAYAMLADSYALICYYKYNVLPSEETLDKATQVAEKALELNPNLSEALSALALIHICENKGEEAYPLLVKATKLNPNNGTAYHRLGSMLVFNNKLKEGIVALKNAEKSDPESVTANILLAIFLSLDKKTDEALLFAEKAVLLNPNSTEYKVILAKTYEQKGLLDKSKEILKSVLEEDPQNQLAILTFARICAKSNDEAIARNYLEKVFISDGSRDFYYERALVYLYLGESDKAFEYLKKVKITVPRLLILREDYNLNPIRNTIEFKEIYEHVRNALIKRVQESKKNRTAN